MGRIKIKRDNGEIIDLHITQRIAKTGGNKIIVYESPAGNGGWTINNGRINESLALNGRITSNLSHDSVNYTTANVRELLSSKITTIEDIKDNREVITLETPVNGNKVSRWWIESFEWDIVEGSSSYINFTLRLVEYRQANYDKTIQNLVGSEALQEIIEASTITA